MKLKDVEVGKMFTINNTPSYPKLRTEYGYLDMRDRIRKGCDDLPWEIREMDKEEVARQFDTTIQDIEDWIKDLPA